MKARNRTLVAALLAGLLTLQGQAQGTTGAPPAPSAPSAPPTPPGLIIPPGTMMAEGRIYNPGAFDGVEIGGSAEVRYQQGDVDEVFIAGNDEVQRSVKVELRGSQLRIRSNNGWRFRTTRRLQVQITSRQLTRLSVQGAADWVALGPVNSERLAVHISGAGRARFDKLNSANLSFSVSGAGDGQFQGQVQDLSVQISGKSDFSGENLQARNARITVSGIGDVKVWVVDDLNITVSGIGKVEYWGRPHVRQRTSGPATIDARGPRPSP